MVVLPLVVLALTLTRGHYRLAIWTGLGFAAFAGMVMAYSGWQVRRGRWSHVDASHHEERRSLNRFLLLSLLISTALAFRFGLAAELTLGLALAAAMVAVAMLISHWCKLSLHMAFVVFAALLMMINAPWWAGLVGLCFTAAVAWSRLALQRHVPRDLVAGALTGTLAGIAFAMATSAGAA